MTSRKLDENDADCIKRLEGILTKRAGEAQRAAMLAAQLHAEKDIALTDLAAKLKEAQTELADWRQAAGVEASLRREFLARAEKLEVVLRAVRRIIVEGAETGFNCHDGDWAGRLFASQALTYAVLASAPAPATGERFPEMVFEDSTHCDICGKDVYDPCDADNCGVSPSPQASAPTEAERVGEYRADYSMPTREELDAPDPELDELYARTEPSPELIERARKFSIKHGAALDSENLAAFAAAELATSPHHAEVETLRAEVERLTRALEDIAVLDDADGHTLKEMDALRAVAIATSTLGWHPSTIYHKRLAADRHPLHFGDPCVHCGTPHDDVQPGPCTAALRSSQEPGR